jgi:hypothetical protein
MTNSPDKRFVRGFGESAGSTRVPTEIGSVDEDVQSAQFLVEGVGERCPLDPLGKQPGSNPKQVQCSLASLELADLALGDPQPSCQRGLVDTRGLAQLHE